MNFSILFSNIQWFPVVVMTLLSFVIGMLWHRPFLFGRAWVKENYPDGSPHDINAPLVFGGTAIVHFIALAALSAFVSATGGLNGFLGGLSISLFWILTAIAGTYLFASRSLKLLAIDAGMYIVLFSLCGFILGVW
ncbi:MAG: DUF1761 domain-containing protein [Bacteroidales bacterium]|nr:DUF1761 domain-containing protein [Bacteroidales bacterium]